MIPSVIYGLGALATLVPVAVLRLRADDRSDGLFWAGLALGIVGPASWAAAQLGGAWRTGFAMSLWLTIAVTMALFAGVALTTRQGWRLTPLLVPYLVLLGIAALVWQHAPEHSIAGAIPPGWIEAHIIFALISYGLLTLAAVAGVAVFLQDRALKTKRPTAFTHRLPAVAESERLQVRLLAGSEVVLALGLMSGMAAEHFLHERLLVFDHKTVFSLATFVVIGLLLIVHRFTGVRGQRAARWVLVAYLLLTLAYPGVKFVTDVLIG